jgi:hypothetical protein
VLNTFLCRLSKLFLRIYGEGGEWPVGHLLKARRAGIFVVRSDKNGKAPSGATSSSEQAEYAAPTELGFLLRGGFYKDVAPTALNHVPMALKPVNGSKTAAWVSFEVTQDFAGTTWDFAGVVRILRKRPGILREEVGILREWSGLRGSELGFCGRSPAFAGTMQDFAGGVQDFTGTSRDFAGAVQDFAGRLALKK